jgi:TfoX/Sxy family transcriptional regulator of competence genes
LVLKEKNINFKEMKMMGGIAFMVNDKMCVGIINNDLMARIDPDIYEDALTRKDVREMDFTKRPMKGYIYVEPEGIDFESDLDFWLQKGLDFNPFAVGSKSKKKKK